MQGEDLELWDFVIDTDGVSGSAILPMGKACTFL
jgi:hypothetical protein